MSLFDNGEEVFTMTSFIGDEGWQPPCGCQFGRGSIPAQLTNILKDEEVLVVAECPLCGTTWDDY